MEKPSEAIGKTVGLSYAPSGEYQKAPGKGGHHLAPFGPSTNPEGYSVTHLTHGHGGPPVKGISMHAMLVPNGSSAKWRVDYFAVHIAHNLT